eukprot:scaffold952_cov56-Cyclotella_meneghiniana.AAC.3
MLVNAKISKFLPSTCSVGAPSIATSVIKVLFSIGITWAYQSFVVDEGLTSADQTTLCSIADNTTSTLAGEVYPSSTLAGAVSYTTIRLIAPS